MKVGRLPPLFEPLVGFGLLRGSLFSLPEAPAQQVPFTPPVSEDCDDQNRLFDLDDGFEHLMSKYSMQDLGDLTVELPVESSPDAESDLVATGGGGRGGARAGAFVGARTTPSPGPISAQQLEGGLQKLTEARATYQQAWDSSVAVLEQARTRFTAWHNEAMQQMESWVDSTDRQTAGGIHNPPCGGGVGDIDGAAAVPPSPPLPPPFPFLRGACTACGGGAAASTEGGATSQAVWMFAAVPAETLPGGHAAITTVQAQMPADPGVGTCTGAAHHQPSNEMIEPSWLNMPAAGGSNSQFQMSASGLLAPTAWAASVSASVSVQHGGLRSRKRKSGSEHKHNDADNDEEESDDNEIKVEGEDTPPPPPTAAAAAAGPTAAAGAGRLAAMANIAQLLYNNVAASTDDGANPRTSSHGSKRAKPDERAKPDDGNSSGVGGVQGDPVATARGRAAQKGPKRPLTAYTCFVKDVRSRTMQDNPDKSFQQVAAMVGKRWKELSDQERAPYRNQALLDSERFQREKLDILIADTQKIVSSMKGGNSSSGV